MGSTHSAASASQALARLALKLQFDASKAAFDVIAEILRRFGQERLQLGVGVLQMKTVSFNFKTVHFTEYLLLKVVQLLETLLRLFLLTDFLENLCQRFVVVLRESWRSSPLLLLRLVLKRATKPKISFPESDFLTHR